MPRPELVAVARDAGAAYPARAPFNPGEHYPEAALPEVAAEPNAAYALVRRVLMELGLDRARVGTPEWNPLGDVVRPGDRVVVKPNLVHHGSGDPDETEVLLTHAAVTRALLDFVIRALDGRGEITVGDAPLQSGNFEKIVAQTRLGSVIEYLAPRAGVPLSLVDFRQECVSTVTAGGFITGRTLLAGEVRGYRVVDVGAQSALLAIEADHERYRVTDYTPGLMRAYQAPGRHQYVIPQVILDADVVINVPKMKTHRKAGLTCALKNLVGINGRKDCLPHHRKGSRRDGGDEFPHHSFLKGMYSWCDEVADRIPLTAARLLVEAGKHVPKALAKLLAKDPFFEGSWYGNDTLWRTVHDLNRILLYANAQGQLGSEPVRRVLHVVDAIVAGEGEGPLEPSPVRCGMLIAGASALSVDAVAATLMGLDPERIPIIARAFGAHPLCLGPSDPDTIAVALAGSVLPLRAVRRHLGFHFRPPLGWSGHVEWDGDRAEELGVVSRGQGGPA